MKPRVLIRALCAALLLALAISSAAVFAFGGYDLRLGPIHFAARSAFKSLLQMEGAFLLVTACLAILQQKGTDYSVPPTGMREKSHGSLWGRAVCPFFLLVCAAYASSLAIRFRYYDWEHGNVTGSLHSLRDFAALFTQPEWDRFYRPLTFFSLWADDRLFGSHGWGHHLQNLAMHAANGVLLMVLARKLGFSEVAARGAAVLFAVAAVNFEVVMWPGARFDLLAAMFTLIALILALRYLESGRIKDAVLSVVSMLAAILNKESAYCFPLILGCLILFWPAIQRRPIPWKRGIALAAGILPVIGALLLVRFSVLGGVGGYPPLPGGTPTHTAVTARSLLFLITRPPLALMGINTTARIQPYLTSAVACFGAAMAAAVLLGARAARAALVLLPCAILSAVPTLNIIGWVGDSMLEARYLYMPCLWLSLFAAAALGASKRPVVLLAVWAAANLAGLEHNLGVYRTALASTVTISQRVERDYLEAGGSGPILISELPIRSGGVLFIGPELVSRIQDLLPGVAIRREDGPAAPGACPLLWYRWDAEDRDLVRQHCVAAGR